MKPACEPPPAETLALEEFSVSLDDGRPHPAGLSLFLDPQEGWVMSAAEAAGHSGPAFEARFWPPVPGAELAHNLSPAGLTFVWRQKPKSGPAALIALAEHFRYEFASVLIVADAPAELEPLAPALSGGAVFLGAAAPGAPLHPLSMYTQAERAREAREREQDDLRNRAAFAKRDEAAVKARLTLWEDLEALEQRFETLGRDVARCRGEWETVRQETRAATSAWEEARAALESGGQGLLGWLRKSGPEPRAVRREELARQAVDAAESAMRAVRREEEEALAEARRLEERLGRARRDSEGWTGRAELAAELAALRGRREGLEAQLSVALRQEPIRPEHFLEAAKVILALTADLQPGERLAGQRFPAIMVLTDHPPDHDGRRRLAALAGAAEAHLVIFGDFTFWPIWSGRAPTLPHSDIPAWSGLTLAEERDELKEFLAGGGLFSPRPLPGGGPALLALPVGRGLGLRALGEMGPANPVSALAVARAAAAFAETVDTEGPAVIILTASVAQARLLELTLRDLAAPAGKIFCGQPQDFIHWPQVPLVIVEPAFEAPHLSHPWAWPSFGRQRLMWAWSLAKEQIWLAGRDDWTGRLSAASPLKALWGRASAPAPTAEAAPAPSLQDALAGASREIWAMLPPLVPAWWETLQEPLLAAARRRVAVTLFTPPPGPDSDRDYLNRVFRALSLHGVQVYLAEGLPGFLGLVDGIHLTWGEIAECDPETPFWDGLESALIPLAGPEIGEILQLRLIQEKMGRRGGGLKSCPQCGWPLVLINQDRARGFGDEQPLKLTCLGCSPKTARRLDEREPFSAPPRCGVSRRPYQRVRRGRLELWVCPEHPDGPDCPSYKALPGDAI